MLKLWVLKRKKKLDIIYLLMETHDTPSSIFLLKKKKYEPEFEQILFVTISLKEIQKTEKMWKDNTGLCSAKSLMCFSFQQINCKD